MDGKKTAIVLCLLCCVLAVFVFVNKETNFINLLLAFPKGKTSYIEKEYDKSTTLYKASWTLPEFTNLTELNTAITEYHAKLFDEFINMAQDNWNVIKESEVDYPEQPFSFVTTCKYGGTKGNLISVELVTYSFSGGAHGSTIINTFNYSKKENRFLTIEECSGLTLEKISSICFSVLNKKFTESLGEFDKDWLAQGTSPEKENYQLFLIDNKKLTVLFDDYQVGPHAIGPQEVEIDL